MNILYDLISLQHAPTGGTEYIFCILNKLIEIAKENIHVFCLYTSAQDMPMFLISYLEEKKIETVDMSKIDLSDFVKNHNISVFYIGNAQTYYDCNLKNLSCKIIATCHDINELSLLYDKNFTSVARKKLEPQPHPYIQKIKEFIKYFLHIFIERKYERYVTKKYKKLEVMLNNKNLYLITVSEYSKQALLYHFDDIANPITVLSPPHKIVAQNKKECITNTNLKDFIASKKRYFLLVSCTRFHKNAALFAEIWDKFCKVTNNTYYAVLIGDIQIQKTNILQLPYLNDFDLEVAYKNAFCLVYPTVAEGYGYPPMEAMKYGIPCICSNVTSLPEIYGDGSTIQFSPYYPEDLFRAMMYFLSHTEEYKVKANEKYKSLAKKQEEDTNTLVQMIVA